MQLTSRRTEQGPRRDRARLVRYAVVGSLVVLLILWLWLFSAEHAFRGGPAGKSFGADFAMFVGAAQVLHQGGNPYDHAVLYRVESRLMAGQSLPMTHRRAVVRVGNPPLFFWLLQPAARARFQTVAWPWILALCLASLAGFLCLLRYLRWTHYVVPSLIFMMMPPVVLGAFYGNVIGFVFLGSCVSVLLAERYPSLAGAAMVLAWLKPPVALPIAMLVWLFLTARRGRFLAGFAGATAAALALTLVTTGGSSLVQWLGGLFGYAHDMAIQPDVASFAGLYVLWAPAGIRLVLGALTLAAAGALTAWAWLQQPGATRPALATAWLSFVWLLATPYAHVFDLMLLALPVLALLGRNGELIARRGPAVAVYLMFLSLLFIQPTPFRVYLLPLPVLIAGLIAYANSREPARDVLATAA
jgi:hypothetical protein